MNVLFANALFCYPKINLKTLTRDIPRLSLKNITTSLGNLEGKQDLVLMI